MQRLQFFYQRVSLLRDCMCNLTFFHLAHEKYMAERAASKWAARSKLPPPTQSEKRALLFLFDSSGYIRHLPFLAEIRSGEHLIMFHLQESAENFCCCSRNPLFTA
jgi:hypothetical protein